MNYSLAMENENEYLISNNLGKKKKIKTWKWLTQSSSSWTFIWQDIQRTCAKLHYCSIMDKGEKKIYFTLQVWLGWSSNVVIELACTTSYLRNCYRIMIGFWKLSLATKKPTNFVENIGIKNRAEYFFYFFLLIKLSS